jgi:hypothetical protein
MYRGRRFRKCTRRKEQPQNGMPPAQDLVRKEDRYSAGVGPPTGVDWFTDRFIADVFPSLYRDIHQLW